VSLEAFKATTDDVASHYGRQPKQTRSVRKTLELPRHEKGERFIRGPLPMEWFRLASQCGQRAEAVALLLWYAAGWQRSNPVKLTPPVLSELNVHPRTAKRCLQRMAAVGLVEVEFKRGRSPSVTIRDPKHHTVETDHTD